MSNIIINVAGANPARRTTAREFPLAQVGIGDDGKSWLYVRAGAATGGTLTGTVSAGVFTPTATSPTHQATAAFLSGEYGWVYKITSPF